MNPDMLMMLAGGLITLIVLVIALLPSNDSKALEKRIKRVASDEDKPEKKAANLPKVELKRKTSDSGIPFFDRFIKTALPNPEKLRNRLARTGMGMTISEYLLLTGLMIAIFFMLFHLVFGQKLLPSCLLSVMLGVWIPHVFIGMKGAKRCKNFIKFFPESIDAMVRGIRSGLPISESINVVGEEMPDPIGFEFRSIKDAVRMGRSLEEAMWDVAKRVDVPEYRYLIIALSIQRETGGNLAETLANVSEVLRKRRQIKLKIKAMSSEAKASAMILGALPFIVSLVLGMVATEYIMLLFNDPRGNILLGVAFGMLGFGIWIMSQMINFEI
jgi:tight adherence protein B